MDKLNYKGEFLRKVIHVSSSIFPLSLMYFDQEFCKVAFTFLAIIFIICDYLRTKIKLIQKLSNYLFKTVTRPNEKFTLTGASYVFISAALCAILFDRDIAIISLFILSICDSMAALIGIRFGKPNFFD